MGEGGPPATLQTKMVVKIFTTSNTLIAALSNSRSSGRDLFPYTGAKLNAQGAYSSAKKSIFRYFHV